jgi:hypothetical protein
LGTLFSRRKEVNDKHRIFTTVMKVVAKVIYEQMAQQECAAVHVNLLRKCHLHTANRMIQSCHTHTHTPFSLSLSLSPFHNPKLGMNGM